MHLPNGVRLSCAANDYGSQMQFYYEGRRQLQPHVRPRGKTDCKHAGAPDPETRRGKGYLSARRGQRSSRSDPLPLEQDLDPQRPVHRAQLHAHLDLGTQSWLDMRAEHFSIAARERAEPLALVLELRPARRGTESSFRSESQVRAGVCQRVPIGRSKLDALSNGLRLSCGATLYGSRTLFYPRGRAPSASGACYAAAQR